MTDETTDPNALYTREQIISFLGWPWKRIIKYYLHGEPPLPIKKERTWQSDTEMLREWKLLWLQGKVKLPKAVD